MVTNTTGWELNDELAEWSKVELFWNRLPTPLSPVLLQNIAEGQETWGELVSAIHAEEAAEKEVKFAPSRGGNTERRPGESSNVSSKEAESILSSYQR